MATDHCTSVVCCCDCPKPFLASSVPAASRQSHITLCTQYNIGTLHFNRHYQKAIPSSHLFTIRSIIV